MVTILQDATQQALTEALNKRITSQWLQNIGLSGLAEQAVKAIVAATLDAAKEAEQQAAAVALQVVGAAQAALLEARREAQSQFLAATQAAERAAVQRSAAVALCSAAKRRKGADSLLALVVDAGGAAMDGIEGTSPIEGPAAADGIAEVFQQAAAANSEPAGFEQAVLLAVSGATQRLP